MKFDITFNVRILIRKMNCKKILHVLFLFMFLTTIQTHCKIKSNDRDRSKSMIYISTKDFIYN